MMAFQYRKQKGLAAPATKAKVVKMVKTFTSTTTSARVALMALFLPLLTTLPTQAKAYPKQFTKHGPNCLNAALVYSGVMENFRFVEGSEFGTILNSDLCAKVRADDIRPGDLRVYHRSLPNLTAKDRFAHANVYLNENLSFNKMTLYLTSELTLTPEEEVYKTYSHTSNINRFTDQDGNSVHCRGDECINQVHYYLCLPLKEKLLQNQSEDHKRLYVRYLEISEKIEKGVLSTESFDPEIKSLISEFEEDISKTCQGQSDSFICSYYPEAIHSFRVQLHMKQPTKRWILEHLNHSQNMENK